MPQTPPTLPQHGAPLAPPPPSPPRPHSAPPIAHVPRIPARPASRRLARSAPNADPRRLDPSDAPCSACPRRIAAMFKAKINRRRLDKLDVIKICEEILNSSVPTALSPSRILMGEPPLGDYYLIAFLVRFALPSYSNDVSHLLVNLEIKVCSAFY
ncbi:hypothetical protein ZWY2020_038228 [Hordeum vulgare]|nr:hypothetical protein ZWY2020_038228 [Hordeum vulgare]